MYQTRKRRKDPKVRRGGSQGFPGGLNTLAHASTLQESELSELINGVYSQYGTISKRLGSKILGTPDTTNGEITQLKSIYKINGKDYLLRIADDGIPKYFDFNTETWVNFSGTAPSGYSGSTPAFVSGTPHFSTNSITWIVQIKGIVYFANEDDNLVYYDNGQWYIYSLINNPTTVPTVTKTGTKTGPHKWYYRYAFYNEVGGTLASPAVTSQGSGTGWLDNMPEFPDENTYATVTIPTRPSGTKNTAIFRGLSPGDEQYLTSVPASNDTFVDNGEYSPNPMYLVPAANTTTGPHFKLLDSYRGSLVGVSTEEGDDSIVWSGALDKFKSFGLPDGAGIADYRAGEGTTINAIITFVSGNEDALFIFKDNVIGKFNFVDYGDVEGATIKDVNISVGSISPFSPHVAGNNLRFWSRDGAATLGHEANFGTVLRYSVLSVKAEGIVRQITNANINKVCGVFYRNVSMFGISTDVSDAGNNAVLAYDERYDAWSLWTGLYPKIFTKFINPNTKEEILVYGSNKTADVLKMFEGRTDYNSSTGAGTPITLSITTKQYDEGVPDQFKMADKITLVFGALFGNSTTVGITRADHRGVHNDPRLAITRDAELSGFGNDEWGNQEFGMMTEDDLSSDINVKYIDLKQKDLFWLKVNLQNDGIEDEIQLIGIYTYFAPSDRPLPFTAKLRQLAK